MIGYLKRLTVRNIVSPYGLAMISYCIFLFAWLFPPSLYTEYLHEPDLMFLDQQTLFFYTVCVAAFCFGVRFSRFFGTAGPSGPETRIFARRPLFYLMGPILAATLFCLIALILLGGRLNFMALLASQQGDAIKLAAQAGQMDQGRWGEAVPILTAVLWWSLFRVKQLGVKGATKIIFYVTFLTGTGVGIVTCVATVSRTDLMPIILGLLVVYLFRKTRGENVSIARLLSVGFAAGTGVVGTFLLLSFLRGALALRLLIASLLGYTIVSYNRTTALLTGVMHYAYEGRGVYLSRYLLSDDKVNSVFHLIDRFGWPAPFALWQTEFSSTMAAGLNPAYIWSGAFGYVYSDLGWWTPIYVCATGLCAGWLWAHFTAGKTSGLILYPWVAFTVLTWFGTNSIFNVNIIRFIEIAFVLLFYDRLFLRQAHKIDGGRARVHLNGAHVEPFTDSFIKGLI